MTQPDELEMRWPRVVGRLLVGGILIAVLYVLSIGPVLWFAYFRSQSLDSAIDLIYEPSYTPARFTNLEPELVNYTEWWMELPGGAFDRVRKQIPKYPLRP